MQPSRISIASRLFILCSAIAMNSSALAQDSLSAAAKKDAKSDVAQEVVTTGGDGKTSDVPADSPRAIALQTIEQMIEISKRMGDSENAEDMLAYRDSFPVDDDHHCSITVAKNGCEMTQQLRKIGELLSAKQLMPFVLRLANSLQSDDAIVYMGAYHEAAQLDIEFEQYDSALKNMSVAMKAANDDGVKHRDLFVCRANYAYVLRKLRRFIKDKS